jgi:anti-sigma28 factor (negative regulator of flagellin synthesis)
MKIQQHGFGDNQVGQSNSAQQTDRLGDSGGSQGSNSRQIGLDRVEVSNLADTVSRVMGQAGDQRAARIGQIAQIYQSGNYQVNASSLTSAIINHDSEPDTANAS